MRVSLTVGSLVSRTVGVGEMEEAGFESSDSDPVPERAGSIVAVLLLLGDPDQRIVLYKGMQPVVYQPYRLD